MASFKKPSNTTKEEQTNTGIVPFANVQEAWFWFITAQQARVDGARFVARHGRVARPCEPIDILKILDRLYRNRRLQRDHLMVLRYYGRRHLPPDPRRSKEMRAHKIWTEAMERLGVALIARGIVAAPVPFPLRAANARPWIEMEGMAAE